MSPASIKNNAGSSRKKNRGVCFESGIGAVPRFDLARFIGVGWDGEAESQAVNESTVRN